ncbi:MAG: VCBS repeat-containing protein [Acidobacteriia bacterium]|nr:VCBS repeat-containing protein [Terriglobia bacterium]
MRLLTACLFTIAAFPQTPNPAFAPIPDQPLLPRVLLIGDSISIGYTLGVRKDLNGAANVHRIPENAADTRNGLAKIDAWLGASKWDLIHFNWGLHDLKVTAEGGHQVPLETYEQNLTALVDRLGKTGATLIWANTTPVPQGKLNPPRHPEDVAIFNAAAARVMQKAGIATNDLYEFALPRLEAIQLPANVHYTPAGYTALAHRVAQTIRQQLEPKRNSVAWSRHAIDDSSIGADGVRLMDVNGDDKPDIVTGWEEGGLIRAYLNPTRVGARDRWRAVTVGKVRDPEDAVFVDLDQDGRIDVVSSCEGVERSMFVHWAPKNMDQYWDEAAWRTEPIPATAGRMRWMFSTPMQVDGKHGVDLIAGGKDKDAAIGWLEAPANPRDLAGWIWRLIRTAGWIMSIVTADMDADGDLDILASDRKGAQSGVFWLENPGPGPAQKNIWKEHPVGGQHAEVMFLDQADLDGDGLRDVIAAVRPNSIHIYRRLSKDGLQWATQSIPLPIWAGSAKAVRIGDLNNDGKLDVVLSCESAQGNRSGLLYFEKQLSGDGKWSPKDIAGVEGVKYDLIELIDMDFDGDLDVLTCEEVANLGVVWYENPGSP